MILRGEGFISLDEIDQEAQRQLERGDDEIGLDVQQEKKVPRISAQTFASKHSLESSLHIVAQSSIA